MGYSFEFSFEDLDWPLVYSDPSLGMIPHCVSGTAIIEVSSAADMEWHVSHLDIETCGLDGGKFSISRHASDSKYHPDICDRVEDIFRTSDFYREAIEDEISVRRVEGREYEKALV